MNKMGGINTDEFGRTDIKGVYLSRDNSISAPSQLIIAASEESKAVIGVITELINKGID